MKSLILTSFLACCTPALLQGQAAVALAHHFLDAIRARDGDGLRSLLDQNARVVSTATKDGRPIVRSVSITDFIQAVSAASPPWNERLWAPKVLQDDNLALVWANFDFRQGEQVAYCGVMAIEMVRSAAGWRIAHVSETQRNSPCPGPPH